MQTIKLRIAEKIATAVLAINAEAQLNAQDVAAMLEYPPDSNMGDLAFPCFKLSKALRRSPVQIATTLCEALATDEVIDKVEAVNGYFNVYGSPIREHLFDQDVILCKEEDDDFLRIYKYSLLPPKPVEG